MSRLSIVVVVHDMRREAPRTLYSLSAAHQRGVDPADYEVIVVENGSTAPLDPEAVTGLGGNFRYIRLEPASASPARAVNHGAAEATAPALGIMIDGARIATPGAVALALRCLQGFERVIVGTVGFHLGDFQPKAVEAGYDAAAEDRLLASVDWPADGYALFEIGSLAGASEKGWSAPIAESNLLFLPRALFEELGGYDERFDLPGGGFVNPDFYRRAAALADTEWLTMLGEATFHQVHGGAATNTAASRLGPLVATYDEQYVRLRGKRLARSQRPATLIGTIPPAARRWLAPGAPERG